MDNWIHDAVRIEGDLDPEGRKTNESLRKLSEWWARLTAIVRGSGEFVAASGDVLEPSFSFKNNETTGLYLDDKGKANYVVGEVDYGEIQGNAFQTNLYKTSDQTLATSNWTFCTWDAVESVNYGGAWDSGDNTKLFAPVAGVYIITGGIRYNGSPAAHQFSTILVQNGTNTPVRDVHYTNPTGTAYSSSALACVLWAEKEDYFQLYMWQNSGGNVNVTQQITWFTIKQIG